MSQAAELLNSLSGDSVATYTANAEEEHIIIGSDRFIRIPDSLKRLGVQHDKDIETVTFDCPRYWDKHDLSQMVIYVNYVLPTGEDGRYPVQNVVAIGTMLHFDWTISDYVTQYQGQISFLICAITTDEEGNEKLHWNSELNQEAYISEGLECSESPIHQYPDIITHLLTRMDEVEAIATPGAMQGYTDAWLEANHARILAEIEAKGKATLDTIPEDYTETHNMAEESVRTKADAIVGTAKGTVISIPDSSDDHIRNLRVFGKTTQVTTTGTQLFNPYAEQNNSFGNATVENNGSRITVTGTYYVSWPLVLKAGVTYYINFNTVGAATNRAIRFEYPDKEITGTVTNPASFTPTKDTVSVYLYAGLGTEDTIIYENVQISEGSSALPWEPYSAGVASPSPEWPQPLINVENPTVGVHGKNLAVQKYAIDTTTKGMRIFTQNNASEALLNGTAESLFSHTVLSTGLLPPGTYTVSATGVNLHDDGHDRLYVADYYTGKVYANYIRDGSHKTITITEPARFRIDMVFKEGTVYNNSLIKIQIESGDVATEYEPCKVTQSISSDHAFLGVPVELNGNYIDSNGQQWVCDEVDFERGMYVQRIGTEVFDGSIDEIWHDELVLDKTVMFRIQISDSVNVGNVVGKDYLCSNFVVKNMYNSDVQGTQHTMQQFYFRLNKTALPTADTEGFRSYLGSSPMTVNYVLAVPIETPLTAAELEAFKALYTNRPNTTVFNDSGAPMELTYNVDTKTYVDNGIQRTVAEVMEAIANGSY